MGAEEIDYGAVMAEHEGEHRCLYGVEWGPSSRPCPYYVLAKAASDLVGKVARVEALRRYVGTDEVDPKEFGPACLSAREVDAALADQPEQVQPDHEITLPSYRMDEGPAVCTTCGGFLYMPSLSADPSVWRHVRDREVQP